MHVNINGVWRSIPEMYVCVNGVMRITDRLDMYNGVWRARHKHEKKDIKEKGT